MNRVLEFIHHFIGAFMPILHKPHISKQRIVYPTDVLLRAVERYNATHVKSIKTL